MEKDDTYTVKLIDEIAPIISSRDIVVYLKDLIVKMSPKSVVFDFDRIEFVSRSAAHEFLLLKDYLRNRNIESEFIHVDNEVAHMPRLVAANRTVPKSTDAPQFERVTPEILFA